MPFSILPYRLAYAGQKLALVADTPAQLPLLQAFVAQMSAWHPAFNFSALGGAAYSASVSAAFAPILASGFSTPNLAVPVIPPFSDCIMNFSSTSEFNSYITSTAYDTNWETSSTASPKVFGAITFIGDTEYSIRLNFTQTPSTDSKPVDILARAPTLSNILNYLTAALYVAGPPFLRQQGDPVTSQPMPGFLTLQREVDRFLLARSGAQPLAASAFSFLGRFVTTLQMLYLTLPIKPADAKAIPSLIAAFTNLSTSSPPAFIALQAGLSAFLASEAYAPNDVDVVPFPVASYSFNRFYGLALSILSFILVIAYVVPNSRLIRGLVGEKESKMREGMKMMGLGGGALFGSHMLWYALAYHLPVSLIVSAIAKGSFFKQTPFGSTFILFWLFGVSSTAFMYFLSTFFSNAKTASTFCILIFIAAFFPNFAFTATTSIQQKLLASLLCPTAFGLGINTVGSFESNSAPTDPSVVVNNWSLASSIGIMVFDTILYCLLGLYVDAVLPGSIRGYGVARPWYFCCTPSFCREQCCPEAEGASRRGSSSPSRHHSEASGCCARRPSLASAALAPATSSLPSIEASFIEEPDAALRALRDSKRTVELQGLRKEFSTPDGVKVAVESVSLEMYEGQIFVLLGPNGAGKTTAISMLTGLVEPTAGSATFFGQDMLTSQASARGSLGVCPQHDVLWPELTVKEHLDTFAAIKGVPRAALAAEVAKIIKEVGLTEKVHVQASALSGGMKRKLSVAIALIGGSKVVILDEPTSGMDPYSRRSTWNILQNARAGRIILMTTHFMDEADILGDRIAIMGSGKVKCCGTPLFLKKRYGVGYVLVLVRSPGAPGLDTAAAAAAAAIQDGSASSEQQPTPASSSTAGILAFMRRHIPAASIATSVAAELSVRLPLASSPVFPAMLEDLDASRGALGIASYGISVTSIEDVFLRIANQQDAHAVGGAPAPQAAAVASYASGSSGSGSGSSSSKVGAFEALADVPPHAGKAVQIEMPSAVRKQLEDSGSGGAPGGGGEGAALAALEAVRAAGRAEARGCGVFVRHLGALLRKRAQYAMRDSRAIVCQLVLPILLIAVGLGLISAGAKTTYVDLVLSTSAFNGGAGPQLVPNFAFKGANGSALDSASLTALLQASPDLWVASSATTSAAMTFSQARAASNITIPAAFTPTAGLASPLLEYQQMSAFLLGDRQSYSGSKYGALVFNRLGVSAAGQDAVGAPPGSPGLSVGILCNTTALHAAPTWLNALNSAQLAALQGSPSARIVTHNYPMPQTFRQAQLFNGLLTFSASLIIIIAFSFVAANTALYVVREREVSAKHQQLISGVSVPAYWLANFLFDYAAFCVPASVAIVLCRAFNIQDFISRDADQLAALCLNFYLFGLASTASTYIICFIFKSPSAAQGTVLFVNIFAIILIAASQFLSQLQSTCTAELSLKYVFALLPSYAFGRNLVTLAFLPTLPLIDATCSGVTKGLSPYRALELRATGAMLIYMVAEFLAYCLVILAIEYVQSRPSLRQALFPDPRKAEDPVEEDEDVAAEAARVEAMRAAGAATGAAQDTILISKLRKVYGTGKTAVRELSFGVPSGEVFGFLGINGAGKTTTLQILSGDVLPTSGTATMAGFDILSQQPQVRRLLGYCPQFDSLMELLTVREHLELFARIKGVPEAEVPAVVRKKVADLDLGQYANKTAGSLSGGNKRKLCVAIALIGDPPLVFLDEPSTGMDPVGKLTSSAA